MEEKLKKVVSYLDQISVRGSNNVMLLGQAIFDLTNILQECELEKRKELAQKDAVSKDEESNE